MKKYLATLFVFALATQVCATYHTTAGETYSKYQKMNTKQQLKPGHKAKTFQNQYNGKAHGYKQKATAQKAPQRTRMYRKDMPGTYKLQIDNDTNMPVRGYIQLTGGELKWFGIGKRKNFNLTRDKSRGDEVEWRLPMNMLVTEIHVQSKGQRLTHRPKSPYKPRRGEVDLEVKMKDGKLSIRRDF